MINKTELEIAFDNHSIEDIILHIHTINDISPYQEYINSNSLKESKHIHNCRRLFLSMLHVYEQRQFPIIDTVSIESFIEWSLDTLYPPTFLTHNQYTQLEPSEKSTIEDTTHFILTAFCNENVSLKEAQPHMFFHLIAATLNEEHINEIISFYNEYSHSIGLNITDLFTYFSLILLLDNSTTKYKQFTKRVYNIPLIRECVIQNKHQSRTASEIHQYFTVGMLKENIESF